MNRPLCAEQSSRAKRTWDSRLAGGGGDGVDALRFQRSFVLHTSSSSSSSSRGCAALQEQQLILGLEVGVVACLPQVQRRRAVVEGRWCDGEAAIDCLLRLGSFDNLRSNRGRSNPVRQPDSQAASRPGSQAHSQARRQAASQAASQPVAPSTAAAIALWFRTIVKVLSSSQTNATMLADILYPVVPRLSSSPPLSTAELSTYLQPGRTNCVVWASM